MKKFIVGKNKQGELCEQRKNVLTGEIYWVNKNGEKFTDNDIIATYWN